MFALVNLPETVKGALFARYSPLPGHAAAAVPRRVRGLAAASRRPRCDDDEGERAAELYERIFVGYGDDSVAQLGGAHVAASGARTS